MIPYPGFFASLSTALAVPAPALVQAQDTLHLAPLHSAALQRDPRARQPELLRSATEYRLAVLGSERLPQLQLHGWASHQSDVTSVPISLPGVSVRRPVDDRWETAIEVRQTLWDGGDISRRRDLERARLAESTAGVEVALYQLRGEVNTAFFSAFLMQQQAAEYDALLSDLAARFTAVRARVDAGTALRREAAEIEAEEVRAMQGRDQAQAGRRAALATLASLVGRPIDTSVVLILPAEAPEEAHPGGPATIAALRSRPEFGRINLTLERLGREADLTRLENTLRVFAFGQAGAGTPGLDQFRADANVYWQAGVRLEWSPWTWGSARRNAAAIRQEQEVLKTEERALGAALARLILQRHLVELARARAGFLTTLGLASSTTGHTP